MTGTQERFIVRSRSRQTAAPKFRARSLATAATDYFLLGVVHAARQHGPSRLTAQAEERFHRAKPPAQPQPSIELGVHKYIQEVPRPRQDEQLRIRPLQARHLLGGGHGIVERAQLIDEAICLGLAAR